MNVLGCSILLNTWFDSHSWLKNEGEGNKSILFQNVRTFRSLWSPFAYGCLGTDLCVTCWRIMLALLDILTYRVFGGRSHLVLSLGWEEGNQVLRTNWRVNFFCPKINPSFLKKMFIAKRKLIYQNGIHGHWHYYLNDNTVADSMKHRLFWGFHGLSTLKYLMVWVLKMNELFQENGHLSDLV